MWSLRWWESFTLSISSLSTTSHLWCRNPYCSIFIAWGLSRFRHLKRSSRQDAGERSSREGQESWTRLLQQAFLGRSVILVETRDRSLMHQQLSLSKFKMEMISSVLGCIRKGNELFIDLNNAYFQIPFHSYSWSYLQIALNRKVLKFNVVCFDLAIAPQVFTRVFSQVSERASGRGIQLLCHLDDWPVIVESVSCLLEHY